MEIPKKTRILCYIFFVLSLSACSRQNEQAKDLKDLQERLITNEAKIISLESKIKDIDDRSQGNWILWQSTEWADTSKFNNFGWPKMLSAHASKSDCMIKTRDYSFSKNNKVLEDGDPYKISDGITTISLTCLPPTVDLRGRVK